MKLVTVRDKDTANLILKFETEDGTDPQCNKGDAQLLVKFYRPELDQADLYYLVHSDQDPDTAWPVLIWLAPL